MSYIDSSSGCHVNLVNNTNISRRKIAKFYGEAVFFLSPLLLIYWILPYSTELISLYDFLNATLPVYFISVLIFLSIRVLKRVPETLWTGVFWFPVQAAVFYGFGPLVEIFGNAVTRESLSRGILPVNELELFRAHKLSTTGVFFVILGFFIHLRLRRTAWERLSLNPPSLSSIANLGIMFVVFGGFFKYLILLPAQWGSLNIIIPGVLSGFGNAIDIGFAIIAFSVASGSRISRIFFWALWPLHLILLLVTFAKIDLVIAILLPLIGAYLGDRSKKRLISGLLALAVIFTISQPFVHYGRSVVLENTGTIYRADFMERLSIIGGFFSSNVEVFPVAEERQGWWTRLNYAGPQAHAMNLYDQGIEGNTVGGLWMSFIPRAIWSDKPIIIGPGLEFYRTVTGRFDAQSFLGLSIHGDLYWNFGWLGVIFGSISVGYLFAIISSQSLRVVRNRDFLLLPAVFLALSITLEGPNKYIANGIIGPLPIYFAYYFIFGWLSRVQWLNRKSNKT